MRRIFCILFFTLFLIYGHSCSIFKSPSIDVPISPWATFQHDIRRSGRSPYPGPEVPVLLWKFETKGGIFTPPTIDAEGTIYMGSDDHFLYAINPDGTEKWRFEMENWVRTCPVLSKDGTIYAGSRDDYLYAIKPDGTMKWKFKTGS